MFLYGFLQDFLFFCRCVHAIGQAAVIKGNGRVLHGSADFERNRLFFGCSTLLISRFSDSFWVFKSGIAAADNVQAVGNSSVLI